jgi:pyruvate dehydrogenase E1 component
MLNPTNKPRRAYIETVLDGEDGPYIAASDYVQALAEQINPWVPGGLFALGTDGMGRSETRETLRRHFEVDAECIVIAALHQLYQQGKVAAETVAGAIKSLGVDPDKINPQYA